MRIGLLTGGGDCPGLNAAIRAVVRNAERGYGDSVIGFHHGWRGVVEGDCFALSSAMTRGILGQGGTILGTARYHPDEHPGGVEAVGETLEREQLDALIVVGGDGTLSAAHHIAKTGVPVIGIPKTIDNDVFGTEACIGFNTALTTATEAIDRVHTTAESHDRTMVIEVMGRARGWLAVCAGLASGADAILIPEEPVELDALVAALERRHRGGASYSIVVVAEGVELRDEGDTMTEFGDLGDGEHSTGRVVSREIARRSGYETRLTVLGHVQRGGPATPTDRLLGTRFGSAAVDALHEGCASNLVALRGDEVVINDLALVSTGARPVPRPLLELVRRLAAS